MINHKEHIIKYFESGIKDTKNFKMGIEHEKFLFYQKTNKRVNYSTVQKMFSALTEFGWKPIIFCFSINGSHANSIRAENIFWTVE